MSIVVNGVWLALPPLHKISSCPMSISVHVQHLSDRAESARTLPKWFTMSRRRLYQQSAIAKNL
jgi:hypothetical protein